MAGDRRAFALALLLPATSRAAADEDMAAEMMDWGTTAFALAEVLEYVPFGEARPVRYDLVGWAGGARNRIWAKADGEQGTTSVAGGTQLQALYGRLVSPYWDLQVGVRVDARYGDADAAARPSLALGMQGLAPGWFELEPTLYLSSRGEVWGSLTASYDLLLTQRLVLQPRLETDVAVQEVPEWGLGSGLQDLEVGLRLRYEIRREVAPYLGGAWSRLFGGTARFAEAADEPTSEVSLVAGLRVWL